PAFRMRQIATMLRDHAQIVRQRSQALGLLAFPKDCQAALEVARRRVVVTLVIGEESGAIERLCVVKEKVVTKLGRARCLLLFGLAQEERQPAATFAHIPTRAPKRPQARDQTQPQEDMFRPIRPDERPGQIAVITFKPLEPGDLVASLQLWKGGLGEI